MDIFKFLDLCYADKTILDHIKNQSDEFKEVFNIENIGFEKIRDDFLLVIEISKSQYTSNKVKQIYFPIDKNEYHNLSILTNSFIASELNHKVREIKFSDQTKELNTNGIGLFHWFSQQVGTVNGYTNAYWTGITTIELLNAIKIAIDENLTGLYHLVNEEKITKFNLVNIFNKVFDKRLIIEPYDNYKVDKSLLNTRKDFSFKVKSYQEMIFEMKNWIESNRFLYAHYQNLI